ncbi:hypothetical protein T9A_01318 [Alcanivorax jadensis T9]|uniref:Uncharacterized protein n=1 Tax=Alcanivorax jadensis T9 TaxID=1177181 RepID=A0ABR4WF21_9GAMM|nr:hypothetical protein T9A_01318 [Alcanivorax jadensis T9]
MTNKKIRTNRQRVIQTYLEIGCQQSHRLNGIFHIIDCFFILTQTKPQTSLNRHIRIKAMPQVELNGGRLEIP